MFAPAIKVNNGNPLSCLSIGVRLVRGFLDFLSSSIKLAPILSYVLISRDAVG